MGKGLLFFCCACCILVLTIVNLSIGPIVSGTVKNYFSETWGNLNCKYYKDDWDTQDESGTDDDTLKYKYQYRYDTCQREKGMHDMEYTAFIFDIVLGFICGLLGLLHIFEIKKDFVSNTGLIGLICGVIGFVLTLVYVIFNGLVYTTVYVRTQNVSVYKRDGDYIIAEKDGNDFKCLYFDHIKNENSPFAKISDLGKKQYNYDKDGLKDYANLDDNCKDNDNSNENQIAALCAGQEKFTVTEANARYGSSQFTSCEKIYISEDELDNIGITNKDLSDRFLTALILSLLVCLASIGLALFGFLLFRTPGDF